MRHLNFALIAMFIVGCAALQPSDKNTLSPTKSASFPKLTERNRLLGALLPERTCYDVLHYDIYIDINVEKKYLKDGSAIDRMPSIKTVCRRTTGW